MYSATGLNGDINSILFPINHGILRFVGFDVLPPFIAWAVSRVGDKKRKEYLAQYTQRLLSLESTEPLIYPKLKDFDMTTFQLLSK